MRAEHSKANAEPGMSVTVVAGADAKVQVEQDDDVNAY